MPGFIYCYRGHLIWILAELELELIDQDIQMSLVWSRHKPAATLGCKCIVQHIGNNADRLPHIPTILVNDVFRTAAQILLLVIPEGSWTPITVMKEQLTPLHRIGQDIEKRLLIALR